MTEDEYRDKKAGYMKTLIILLVVLFVGLPVLSVVVSLVIAALSMR